MIRFIAERKHRTFIDERGIVIHFYEWVVPNPRGIVQLSHGLGDHALRYEELAQDLANAGYAVYADDHRGHGQTGLAQWEGDVTKMGKLGPGGLRATVDAVRQFTKLIRDEHPDEPLAIIGHSWGSVLAQMIVNRHPEEFDAVVLSGTMYRTLRHAKGSGFNAKFRHLGTTGNEWLSRDEAVHTAFAEDPLTFEASTIQKLGLWDALRLLGRPARDMPVDVPVLILIGSDDAVGGEKSAERLAQAYVTRSGLSDVELIVYTDARHEIFNETNREEVVTDTLEWLDERLPPRM